MDPLITIIVAALVKDGMLTALSATVLVIVFLVYIYRSILKDIPGHHVEGNAGIRKLLENQEDIRRQQAENSNNLILHTKESSDNAANIAKLRDASAKLEGISEDVKVTKDSVAKIEGMLSIMGLTTSRGIK